MKTRELVDLDLIDDNPWQPRQAIDPDALEELAASIDELGVLQTPLGRRVNTGRVQLAFGHQRVGACRLLHGRGAAGPQMELDLTDISDEKMAVIALSENVRRKQLTQIEVVKAHKRAIEETELTVLDLARQLGVDRSTLSNNLRVLELPELVLEHVESGALGLTVAREFLTLQNNDHAHTGDMKRVVDQIANTFGRHGAPDWSRRHVRQLICERVAYNEADFRPLGPRPKYFVGGSGREAAFDVEAFSAKRPDTLHNIPVEHEPVYGEDPSLRDKGATSRVWTCDVTAWRGLQTRATREANKELAAGGGQSAATPAKSVSRDKQFEQVLANDPVWKRVISSREKPGPYRPVNEEEKAILGTRAELRDVPGYGEGFWKVLQKGRPSELYDWRRASGGLVPPWFPDLKECQQCTIGAAYAKSRSHHQPEKPTLCCFNQEHYQEKLQVGEADYRAKLEAHRKGSDRQDLKTVEQLVRQLQPIPEAACQALASALLAAEPMLEWQHPLGSFHEKYSYESAATVRARELLSLECGTKDWRNEPGTTVGLESLQGVDPGHLKELVASLITHHLRMSGQIETVASHTPAPEPVLAGAE